MVARSGEELLVSAEGATLAAVKLKNLGQLTVFGHVQVTTQALQALAGGGIPVSYQTREGRVYGMFTGFDENPVAVRLRQYRAVSDGALRLGIARRIVIGKILNQRMFCGATAQASVWRPSAPSTVTPDRRTALTASLPCWGMKVRW